MENRVSFDRLFALFFNELDLPFKNALNCTLIARTINRTHTQEILEEFAEIVAQFDAKTQRNIVGDDVMDSLDEDQPDRAEALFDALLLEDFEPAELGVSVAVPDDDRFWETNFCITMGFVFGAMCGWLAGLILLH